MLKVGDRVKIVEGSRCTLHIEAEGVIEEVDDSKYGVRVFLEGKYTWWYALEELELLNDVEPIKGETLRDIIEKETISGIDKVLEERENRYGDFKGHAEITQGIKYVMSEYGNWDELSPEMAESLEMIAHKIGRILNGDPTYKDSWTDIIGYAKLIEDTLDDE